MLVAKSFKEFVNEIKIGATKRSGDNAALEAFMGEYWKNTSSHPFDRSLRIWNDSIGFDVSKFDGAISLGSVMSFIEKNAGEASKALKWLCELADKHGVEIDLYVKPIKGAGAKAGKDLNKAQLKAWYTKNGFVSKRGDDMTRMPK